VKQYPMIQNRGTKIIFGLYLMAMLFLSRDTLVSSCLIGFTKSQLLMFGLILLLGIVFLFAKRKQLPEILKDRRIVLMAVSSAIILIPMLVKQDWQLMYFSVLLCLLFSVFLTYFTTSREIAKYYVVILTALGLYSIFATYVLRELAQAGILTVPVFLNSNDWDFYNFGFAYAVTWEYWHRNFGIFREPGVYQFFILLAVYLNNYLVDWDKNWKLWLCNVALAFTMLTTFAIGGFAELGLFILFVYFDKKWYRENWGKFAGAVFALAALDMMAHQNMTSATSGPGTEFTCLTAAIIGGISFMGGKGNVVGLVAGIFVMQIISNGMQLAHMGAYMQYAVKGIILLAAISFDAIKNKPRPAVRVHADEEEKPELEAKA